jgi:hypothetical protein
MTHRKVVLIESAIHAALLSIVTLIFSLLFVVASGEGIQ